MKEYINILKRFRKSPLNVLSRLNGEDCEKFLSAIDKSIKLLEKEDNRKKEVIKNLLLKLRWKI